MGSSGKVKTGQGVFFLAGGMLTVIGISLVLAWWQDVVILFRGVVGIVVALTGLVMMYLVKE